MEELTAGRIVAGKYRIEGILASGGMGVVVGATHLELDQRVAIKFLREVSPEALARFQREARLLVRLRSPHVARVFDVGALEGGAPYIVMEHLEGSDFATVVSSRGKLSVEEAVDYVLQASEAIAEAHALGMVHRDLKPANLFLARGPGGTSIVKVLDFGVSKILDDRSASGVGDGPRGGDLTHEGAALGSPGYMSPEQMTNSRDVDARSDIFSLGTLLYRFVGGEAPYKGSSVVSILAAMATEGFQPLRTLAPGVPEAFAAAVERCLAQDKAMRFPSVAHLAYALLPYASRRGRVSIEQILATLDVHMDDAVRASTYSAPPASVASGGSLEGATALSSSPGRYARLDAAPSRAPSATWKTLVVAFATALFALAMVAALTWRRIRMDSHPSDGTLSGSPSFSGSPSLSGSATIALRGASSMAAGTFDAGPSFGSASLPSSNGLASNGPMSPLPHASARLGPPEVSSAPKPKTSPTRTRPHAAPGVADAGRR